ncbi:MAG TPA: HEAT repeat domain-containing protein [Candidatus Dormibacteraeota bacterium]|nr:HEAT repeat domain-containing protein [Candidatus Dormibacteraeota bacterium]
MGFDATEERSAECHRQGTSAVVSGCIDLLRGSRFDDALLRALAGPAAEQVLAGQEGGKSGYWPRVWGARGLLYAWEVRAVPAIVGATTDDSWRVRQMAVNVIARHQLEDLFDAVVRLRNDPVPRVRAAAERALRTLVGSRDQELRGRS